MRLTGVWNVGGEFSRVNKWMCYEGNQVVRFGIRVCAVVSNDVMILGSWVMGEDV